MSDEATINESAEMDDKQHNADSVSAENKVSAESELNDLELAVLQVEKEWWRIASTREHAIRKLTGLTPQQYYLVQSSLLDREYFWKADPVLVDRLRRLRDRKLAERHQEIWHIEEVK